MDEEKKVMLQEMAMQPDFVRSNVDAMLDATRKAVADRPRSRSEMRSYSRRVRVCLVL